MTKFVTEKQFLRARKIIRRLMYKNTMENAPEDMPYLSFGGEGNQPVIGVEGHKMLYIEIPSFRVDKGDLQRLRDLDCIKERDDISVSERGFKIYVEGEVE